MAKALHRFRTWRIATREGDRMQITKGSDGQMLVHIMDQPVPISAEFLRDLRER